MYVLWRYFGITDHQAEHEIADTVLHGLLEEFVAERKAERVEG